MQNTNESRMTMKGFGPFMMVVTYEDTVQEVEFFACADDMEAHINRETLAQLSDDYMVFLYDFEQGRQLFMVSNIVHLSAEEDGEPLR